MSFPVHLLCLAFLGLGGVGVLPLGTLSLGLWIVTMHPAFVTGHQRVNDTRIRCN